MSGDYSEVTLCKISAGGQGCFYAHIQWKEQGKSGFCMQATDGQHCWRGEVSASDMQDFASKASLNLSEFADVTVKAFSQSVNVSAPLRCYVTKTDKSLHVSWKRILANEHIKFQLGAVILAECSRQADVHLEFLSHAMTLIHELQNTCTSLKKENSQLAEERDCAVKKVEQVVTAKEQHEQILFQNFVAVLNSKKRKLRNLAPNRKRQAASADNEEIAASVTKDSSKITPHPVSENCSDDTDVEDMDDRETPATERPLVLNESLLSNDDDDAIRAAQPVIAYRRQARPIHASEPDEANNKALSSGANVIATNRVTTVTARELDSTVHHPTSTGTPDLIADL